MSFACIMSKFSEDAGWMLKGIVHQKSWSCGSHHAHVLPHTLCFSSISVACCLWRWQWLRIVLEFESVFISAREREREEVRVTAEEIVEWVFVFGLDSCYLTALSLSVFGSCFSLHCDFVKLIKPLLLCCCFRHRTLN